MRFTAAAAVFGAPLGVTLTRLITLPRRYCGETVLKNYQFADISIRDT
jgi:hypothetical protein